MRKQNSEFLTSFISEANNDIKNTDYFGFVELDDYACYVIADGIDDELEAVSAKLAVSAAVAAFLEHPSIRKSTVKRCLKAANEALLTAKSKMKLKASVIIVVTDYVKLRYGQAGNIRLRLYRNGFLKHKTTDQSLTMDMVKEDKLSQDKVAAHEERNNLYTYLGQEQDFHPVISKKIAICNADAVVLYTRGVWEHVDEGELQDVFADATDEPQESVNNIEDLLLSRQPEDLRKYTLAAIFINKIFIDPNRKRKIKKIIIAAVLAVVIVAVVIAVVLVLKHRREEKREQMQLGYTDTIEYIQMDNYTRAEECCKETLELAKSLRDKSMQRELGSCQKLIEAVMAAEEQLDKEAYTEAQKAYQEAAKRARYVDNLGLDYINERLALTADYITVYDLIYLGDTLLQNLQYEKAEEKYLEAKAIAAKIYFDGGRTASLDALEKLYEEQKLVEEEQEEARQEQLTKEVASANFAALGDVAFAQGDYDSAKVYYASAVQKYEELADEVQQAAMQDKLSTTEQKLADRAALLQEAEGYSNQAQTAADEENYSGAKKYYLLARDIYASMQDDSKLEEIARKLELLEMKQEENEAKAEEESSAEGQEEVDGQTATEAQSANQTKTADQTGITDQTKTASQSKTANQQGTAAQPEVTEQNETTSESKNDTTSQPKPGQPPEPEPMPQYRTE